MTPTLSHHSHHSQDFPTFLPLAPIQNKNGKIMRNPRNLRQTNISQEAPT
jgi:hypothetical protein